MSVSETGKASQRAGDQPDPVDPEPAQGRSRRSHVSPFVLAMALVFFFGPTLAGLAGVRAQQFENRPLANFPRIQDGWIALPRIGTWATDHLAGRPQAVAANSQVTEHLFREQASDTASAQRGGYPQVIEGRDGWLFLGDDVSIRCKSKADPADIVARMRKLSNVVTRSGRRFLIMIAPDKSSIYPQYLPQAYFGRSCAAAYTARFWSAFNKNPTPGYVDARTPLMAQARANNALLYRPKDTHWGLQGISIEAQLLASALEPSLRYGTQVVDKGSYAPIGDLTYLLGRPQKDVLPAMMLIRRGVRPSPGNDLTLNRNKVTHVRYTSTGAPLYQPRTLILGDSFTDTSKKYVSPYFADLTLLHNRSSAAIVANAMIDRRTVIVQMGERLAITGNNNLLSDAALYTIGNVLAAHPKA